MITMVTTQSGALASVARSHSYCLNLHDIDNEIILQREKATGDILFFHSMDGSEGTYSMSRKYLFQHYTRGPVLSAVLKSGEYQAVMNSEFMSDVFKSKYDRAALVVHNYPEWYNYARPNKVGKGVVWLTKLTKEDAPPYYKFLNYCKRKGIVPTVVSSIMPPKSDASINYIKSIDHEKLPKFLMQFEYGVGIGRSLLDMGIAGLKTVVMGNENVSSHVTLENIEMHMRSNFNGELTKTDESVYDLFDTAKPIGELLMNVMTPERLFQELTPLIFEDKHEFQ